MTKKKPNFILTFGPKLSKEEDDKVLSEFIFTLLRWKEEEEASKKYNKADEP